MANTRRKIYKYELDGTFVRSFESIAEAAEFQGVDESTIRKALDSSVKTSQGYIWRSIPEGAELFFDFDNSSDNTNTTRQADNRKDMDNEGENALSRHLKSLNLTEQQIKSVKIWQTQAGDHRFSVVKDFTDLKEDSEEFFERLHRLLTKKIEPIVIKIDPIPIDRALIFHTSDKHIGSWNDPSRSPFRNDYSKEVVTQRMMAVVYEALHLKNMFGKFDRFIFNDLGDPLDGYSAQTTRGGHTLPQLLQNEEAFDLYVELHMKLFDAIVFHDIANSYEFNAISDDNHSGSFGYSANRALQIYLNIKYPEIDTRIIKKFVDHTRYGDHVFMLCHGKDKEDLKHGMPLHLNDKTEKYITDYIDVHGLKGHLHFVKGDLHQAASEFGKRFRYRNVMSMYGASKWIHNNFGNTKAGISYEIVEKYSPRVMEYNLVF